MEAARKWRLRAERYRDFAALACDSEAQQSRLRRARHFDRLADDIEGGGLAIPAADCGARAVTPLEALRRAIARLTAIAS
jgi:hypothetical protein